ncbi:hypothetical protein ABEF93_006700 [Exophiala dermatitidis]
MSRTWKMMCFLVLLSLCLVGFVDAGAEVANNCPVSIWCAIVMGYDPTDQTPVNERLAVSWVSQNPGQVLSSNFADHAQNTSMAMMCTRDPGANKPLVTQLEYTWMRDLGQTYFDVSNVEGEPFADEGFIMTVKDPKTPLFNTCYGAHCEAGDTSCNQVYEKSTDDFQEYKEVLPEFRCVQMFEF